MLDQIRNKVRVYKLCFSLFVFAFIKVSDMYTSVARAGVINDHDLVISMPLGKFH